jgi:DNA-binding CsgD family transcriptional regulator
MYHTFDDGFAARMRPDAIDIAGLDVGGALEQIDAIRSPGDLESYLTDLAHRLGFQYFSYVLADRRHLGSSGAGEPMFLASYPGQWRSRYRRYDYHTLDPVVTRGRLARVPFFWGDNGYLKDLSGKRRRLFDEARDFGIHSGFTVPVHGPFGECGLFSVATADAMDDFQAVVRRCTYFLQIIGPRVHALAMDRLLERDAAPRVTLTDQERTCLSWTIQGKTAWEIAQIIGRSKPTVDYHIQKATKKLEASNKVHAAFRAVQLGLV